PSNPQINPQFLTSSNPQISEGYIVVGDGLRDVRGRAAVAAHRIFGSAAAARISAASAAAAAAAAEQHDAIAADLGRVSLVAVLVVPLAGLQPALDVNLLALR